MSIDSMPAGLEMDRLVDECVIGGHRKGDGYEIGATVMWDGREAKTFEPSTNIAHAWEVVEKMRSDGWFFRFTLPSGSGSPTEVTIDHRSGNDFFCGIATTAPLAICRAALKAMEKA